MCFLRAIWLFLAHNYTLLFLLFVCRCLKAEFLRLLSVVSPSLLLAVCCTMASSMHQTARAFFVCASPPLFEVFVAVLCFSIYSCKTRRLRRMNVMQITNNQVVFVDYDWLQCLFTVSAATLLCFGHLQASPPPLWPPIPNHQNMEISRPYVWYLHTFFPSCVPRCLCCVSFRVNVSHRTHPCPSVPICMHPRRSVPPKSKSVLFWRILRHVVR